MCRRVRKINWSGKGKTIRELEIIFRGCEDNLGEPLRAVREDVESERQVKLDEDAKKRQEEAWADELVKQLEKEKKVREVWISAYEADTSCL